MSFEVEEHIVRNYDIRRRIGKGVSVNRSVVSCAIHTRCLCWPGTSLTILTPYSFLFMKF